MELSMMVVMTSLAPVVALRTPAIPAHRAPPAAAAAMAAAMCAPAGRLQAKPT